ncbi:lipocalin family protein [Novosphingobium olei]|uniref:Outer membrane lipoprotein Blc n=1 Tax=Novosphingobium olei TaxID=2728851 RepID=A0A7Y0BSH8_9SPHN|nr:lipocalin family protein [Novosphingobium olei]NML95485.1 lipocalin [Novosphingobium olei]BEU99159.1 lipocalin family protein [Novosphingobium olei]
MARTGKLAALGGIAVVAGALAAWRAKLRHPVGNPAVPDPARNVDVERYLGRWYEIARYEQAFEKDCEGATADYALRADGRIDVVNRARRADGKWVTTKGVARIVDKGTNAKLKVRFFGPITGDYWILDHGKEYGWAIVGEGSGRYLWLLMREQVPGEAKVEKLIERAAALGYDTTLLRRTAQP